MAEFAVNVVRIENVTHTPDSDKLSNVHIGGFVCVSAKFENGDHRYRPGELVVYIPEGALLPRWMLERLNFIGKDGKGMLAGPDGNRVKAKRLRGQLSQGVLYPVTNVSSSINPDARPSVVNFSNGMIMDVDVGTDVAEFLEIVKYEPVVPPHMTGQVANLHGKTKGYDLENLKKFPNILVEGEKVVATEKTHGTFAGFGYWPGLDHPELHRGDFFAYSKGNGAKGLVFKDVSANEGNVYHKMMKTFRSGTNHYMDEVLVGISLRHNHMPVFVLSEIFGPGIQDLSYGQAAPTLIVFDIWVGPPEAGKFLSDHEFLLETTHWGLPTAIELYRGPYKRSVMDKLKEGSTQLGGGRHVIEGIVIRPVKERQHEAVGRVIFKHVGDGYLTRGGAETEFN